jgi:tRNA A37 methylthiotransferase MiaB
MRSYYLSDRSCHRRKEETLLVERFFAANGWSAANRPEAADCVILFTCAEMRYKVENMIREVKATAARVQPGAEFLVGSCLPKTNAVALAEVFRGRTITPTDFSALNELPGVSVPIERLPPIFGPNATPPAPCKPDRWRGTDAIPYRLARWMAVAARNCGAGEAGVALAARLCRTRRTAIYASAGCAKLCSYCAIRFATGAVRSKPPEAVIGNIVEGLRLGYRTFDFLSDSIGGYGLDLGSNLGGLLNRVRALPGYFTVGISDLHPHEFLKYLPSILALAKARRLHYLYVPVQSGSERILRLMNRTCSMKDLTAAFAAIRRFREVFLQTGVMAGFPGEADTDFEETVSFLTEIDFDNVYVHYYCDMPDTASSRLPEKINKETMIARLERISRSGVRFNREKTHTEWESTLAIS